MLPKDQQFDQLFRDRLKDHSSPVSTDLWRRIHSGIGHSRRRRFFFWPFLAAIPVGCLVLFAVDPHILQSRHPSPDASSISIHPSTAPNPSTAANPSNTTTSPTAANPPNHYSIISPTRFAKPIPIFVIEPSGLAPKTTSAQTFRTPDLTLPALAHLSTRPAVATPPPVQPSRLACPNLESGISFFDHFYLSLFGAADFPTRYYNFSYTGGVRLTWQFSPHWSATTGLQYSILKAKTNNHLFDTLREPLDQRDLELPLLIGYSLLNDNYTLTVNGGLLLNLNSRFINRSISAWPNHPGPSAYLDVTYNRALNDQWSAFAAPYVRCLFSSDSPPLAARIWATGLQVGLRYHL